MLHQTLIIKSVGGTVYMYKSREFFLLIIERLNEPLNSHSTNFSVSVWNLYNYSTKYSCMWFSFKLEIKNCILYGLLKTFKFLHRTVWKVNYGRWGLWVLYFSIKVTSFTGVYVGYLMKYMDKFLCQNLKTCFFSHSGILFGWAALHQLTVVWAGQNDGIDLCYDQHVMQFRKAAQALGSDRLRMTSYILVCRHSNSCCSTFLLVFLLPISWFFFHSQTSHVYICTELERSENLEMRL